MPGSAVHTHGTENWRQAFYRSRCTWSIPWTVRTVTRLCGVYVPSRRKFFVSREIVAYEDVHPGVTHIESHWATLEDAPLLPDISPQQVQHATFNGPALLESPESDAPPATVDDMNPSGLGLRDSSSIGGSSRTAVSQPAADPTLDPSSIRFKRVLPQRSTRYDGAYFVDPTVASTDQAVSNFINAGGSTACALVAYESAVGGLAKALLVTATVGMGDIQIPRGYNQSLRMPEASYWREAIAKEYYNGLLAIGAFEFVPKRTLPSRTNILRCHLVFDVKRNGDGSVEKFKARLVADGNSQQHGVDFDRVFSTVAKLSTLRLVIAIAALRDYNLTSIDIRQAYLQATLQEEIYMQVPPGLSDVDCNGNEMVVKLRRSLYGLKQAGREWHQLFASTLLEWGFARSEIDICLFTYRRGESILWVIVWVDDCLIADNDPGLRSEFVDWLADKFPVEDKQELQWILHIAVRRDRPRRTIQLSQELYVRDLVGRYAYLCEGLSRRFDSPMDATVRLSPEQSPNPGSPEHVEMQSKRAEYMALVGAFLWLANVSRPELAYPAGQLARYVANPGVAHYRAALRVLVYLKGTVDQKFEIVPAPNSPLLAYVDSDWAAKFSVSGGIISYLGCPIYWMSRMQRSVSMSATEAEYFATCMVAREVVYFRELLCDLGVEQVGPTLVFTDNKGVVDLSYDPVAFKKTKHILRAAQYVRDLVARRVMAIKWVSGSANVAGICTKAVSLASFRPLMQLLGKLSAV